MKNTLKSNRYEEFAVASGLEYRLLQKAATAPFQPPKTRRWRLKPMPVAVFFGLLAGISVVTVQSQKLARAESALVASQDEVKHLSRLRGYTQKQSLRMEALRLQREDLRETQQQLQAEMARIRGIGEDRARTISSMQAEQQLLVSEAQRLQITASRKTAAVESLTEQLSQLQQLVDISLEVGVPLRPEEWAEDQSEQERRYILSNVPSGSPLQTTFVTSKYGMREHPVLNDERLHAGIDFRAKQGTPVYATADGLVEWAGPHASGLGTMVKLTHNFGFSSVYGHLQKTIVVGRDYVAKGDLIGYTGNTGQSSGPHLHYEVSYLYTKLNPKPFVDWSLKNYTPLFDANSDIRWEALARSVRRQLGLLPAEVVAKVEVPAATDS